MGCDWGSRTSTLCWWYRPMDRFVCLLTLPTDGVKSPVMSLSSVDLPAPLGPTSAMRESQSTPNSSLSSKCPLVTSAPG